MIKKNCESMEKRIDEILADMTLEEKFSQLIYDSPALERLGIPAYNWWNECLHGIAHAGKATVFPQAIGLAATFNFDLIEEVAAAISDEARVKQRKAAASGEWGSPYKGLTFWTPNVNIFRDPRWGRGQETYGEDPWLTSRAGVRFVRGLQGDDPVYLKTAACAKHFAVHSGPEKNRHNFDVSVPEQDLAETYLPAFKALAEEGVEAVMGAYNAVNGEPSCASPSLLEKTLRRRWGFRGHVVSDCWAVRDLHEYYKTAADPAEAAAMALNAGCDLNCGCTYEQLSLRQAYDRGLIDDEVVDRSLRRILRARARLGILTAGDRTPWDEIPRTVLLSDRHRALACQAASESVVLLKNDGILPLSGKIRNILVTGPNASEVQALMGNYSGISPRMTSILEGIAGAVEDDVAVRINPGCLPDAPSRIKENWVNFEARNSDVVIAVCGMNTLLEGEEGGALCSRDEGDRRDIGLPDSQREFLEELTANGTPVVLLLTGGSPMALPEELHDSLSALLYIWYPGEAGGEAVADILFGRQNPSGRLPVTVPRGTEQLPPFADYSMSRRTYRYMEEAPLYPFGFGLSYTEFSYEAGRAVRVGEEWTVEATVANRGSVPGRETVQLYIAPPDAGGERLPRLSLKGCRKVNLEPGEEALVRFTLGSSELSFADSSGTFRTYPGEYRICIGGAAPVGRSAELGAARPAEFRLTLP